jgi:hypothetical protein
MMELRYLGFEQQKNLRAYRFDVLIKGEPTKHCVVTADLALFLAHRIGIQDGPGLCSLKLTADLEGLPQEVHELTDADLRAHAAAREDAALRKAEKRNSAPRRTAVSKVAHENSPWRRSGL